MQIIDTIAYATGYLVLLTTAWIIGVGLVASMWMVLKAWREPRAAKRNGR